MHKVDEIIKLIEKPIVPPNQLFSPQSSNRTINNNKDINMVVNENFKTTIVPERNVLKT